MQLTAAGVDGRAGVPVPSPVVVEFKNECEAAPTHGLLMAAETVLDNRSRHKHAIRMPVQVTYRKLL